MLDIVYEDEYIIACVKPYGVPAQPDKTYGTDMVTKLKEYLYDKGDSNDEPYLAVINRLDRPVSGIMLFAKDEVTAGRLSDMLQDGEISKYYQAVVSGYMEAAEGDMTDYLLHDKRKNLTRVVSSGTKGAKKAVLSYEVLDELDTDRGSMSLVLIELHTGRHHQIRCQLASHGTPIWGDTKYGSLKGREKSIGLYSTMLEFTHPMTGERLTLHREPEGEAFDMIDMMDW